MPDEAKKFDKQITDYQIFDKYGYGYVIPPIADSLVNLLNLNSSDLQEKALSFKIVILVINLASGRYHTSNCKSRFHLSKHKNVSNKIVFGYIIRVSHDQFDRINPYQVGADTLVI